MEEFIKSYGTLILAIYGVIQTWIIALYKKIVKNGEIDIYETGLIEVGFSGTAPTIELNGTLRALNKDVFVKSIELSITREKDKAQHIFSWAAFCPPQISSTETRTSLTEIPSGFLISQNSSHRYNIIFEDTNTSGEIKNLFNEYNAKWSDISAQLNKLWSPRSGHYPSPEIEAQQQNLVDNFRSTTTYKDTRDHLASKCYWEAGNYHLQIKVITSKPDRVFPKAFGFTISESDAKKLRANVPVMVEEPISSYFRNKAIYNFASVFYNER